MAESKWLMYNNKALMYGGKGVQHGGGSAFDLYFDLGDQYTLDTKTATTIPLGNPLAGATRRYIAFYMDATLRYGWTQGTIGKGIQFSRSVGEVQNTFGMGPGAYLWPAAFTGVYLSGIYHPNPPSHLPAGTSGAIGVTAPPTVSLLIKIICDTGASNELTVQYKAGTDAWQVSSLVGSGVSVPFDVHGINVIESYAREPTAVTPAFSATDFKGAGFDTLADAEAWLAE